MFLYDTTQSTFDVNAQSYPTGGTHPRGLALRDWDGDGKLDATITHSGSDTVTYLRGNGDGTFQTAVTLASLPAWSDPSSIDTGDLDLDLDLDLVVGNLRTDEVTVLLNTGLSAGIPQFSIGGSFPAGRCPFRIQLADLDADEKLDLIVPNVLGENEHLITNDLFGVIVDPGSNNLRSDFTGRLIAYPKLAFDDPQTPSLSTLRTQVFLFDLVTGIETQMTSSTFSDKDATDPYFEPGVNDHLYFSQKTNGRHQIFRVDLP